jgi:cytochrome c biogenesis protein
MTDKILNEEVHLMKTANKSKRMLDALWDIFASVKLTVVILILLATTSVLGTFIPQKADPSFYIRAYGEFAYRLMQVFDILDMYYSWWFQTLIGILAINITVCTIKRWPAIWKIVSSKNLRVETIKKKKPIGEFSDSRNPDELLPLYKAYIWKKYRRVEISSEKPGMTIVAEKGRWTRLGVPAVHVSIVIILAGALIGSFMGFDGFVNIPEGQSANSIRLRNSDASLPLGFEVRCEDFKVSFYDSGSPKEFRSSLTILENGKKVAEKDIIVNDPLRYKGVNFFQSSYGQTPPQKIQIRLTSSNSGEIQQHNLSMGQTVDLPDETGQFTFLRYTGNYSFRGKMIGEAIVGILEKPGKKPQEIALPLRFPTFDKMRKGDWFISVDGYEDAFYTGLQVTKDPGVPVVYLGFVLLIVGCWIAFFMSHKKIVVDLQPSTNSSRITVYGVTNRNRVGFEIASHQLGEELSNL